MIEQYEDSTKLMISNDIKILRFPLLLMVVLIHCNLSNKIGAEYGSFIVAKDIMYFISKSLCAIAVPTYFLISGYLFFGLSFNGSFTVGDYFNKLKKRFYRLLIPYILWNFIGFILWSSFVLTPLKMFFPELDIKVDIQFFIKCFWSVSSSYDFFQTAGAPIDSPMWFIRDLMILCVFSPIIYMVLKYVKYWAVIVVSILFIIGYLPRVIGFSVVGVLFFTLGAYLSIFKSHVVILKDKNWIIYIALLLMVIETLIHPYYYQYCHSLSIILGVFASICISLKMSDNKKIVDKMSSLSDLGFFIFAFHMLFSAQTNSLMTIIFTPHSSIMWLICYLSSFLIQIFISVLVFYTLKIYTPTILKLLIGSYKLSKTN